MNLITSLMQRMGRLLHRMLVLFVLLTWTQTSHAYLMIPSLRTECFARPGHLIIGVPRSIRGRGPDDFTCSDNILEIQLQRVEAVAYAVKEINKRADILPNISLGFVARDTCSTPRMWLGQMVYFLEDTESLPSLEITSCDAQPRHDHVVAITGTGFSSISAGMAPLLSAAQIPMIDTYATSDELSDKSRYEYFLRLSPPDKYQTEAMLQLLATFNWTYFSIVYTEGSYGENGVKYLMKGAPRYDLCISETHVIYTDAEDAAISKVIRHLELDSRTRAIVLFIGHSMTADFFRLLPTYLYNHFTFIVSDSAGGNYYGEAASGIFVVDLSSREYVQQDFDAHYQSLTPADNPDNPWIWTVWQQLYSCIQPTQQATTRAPLPETTEAPLCSEIGNLTTPNKQPVPADVYIYIDAIYTLALGLDSLIRDKCPRAFTQPDMVYQCVQGPDYLLYLRNVSFDGLTGRVKFDQNGDMLGQYVIRQYAGSLTDLGHVIARWDQDIGIIDVFFDEIDWSLYNNHPDATGSDVIPESVCSHPCLPRQYLIQKEVHCCWECRYCRENEIIVENGTSCELCEENTWPDEEAATVCEPIPAEYVRWSEPLAIGLISLATLGLILSAFVSLGLIQNRQKKLVKASSREMMAIIMGGICLALLTVFCLIAKPTGSVCWLQEFGLSLSVAVIYAPLLVKTNRVYRIFAAGRKGQQHPPLISTRAQILMTTLIILAQVVLTTCVAVLNPTEPILRMPVAIEKYSELLCDLPPKALAILLSFDLFLLILCAGFGFLTRKLPENFNESWYIFVSVATTCFLWIVFLPTYFTTFYAYHKLVLLAACVLLTAIITLLCLFMPKLYALYFVEEGDLKYGMQSGGGVSTMNTATTNG